MSKFKVLESSRFLNNEMNQVKGGYEKCQSSQSYTTCIVAAISSGYSVGGDNCSLGFYVTCDSSVAYSHTTCGDPGYGKMVWCPGGTNHADSQDTIHTVIRRLY